MTLVEVTVAMVILLVGVLGVVPLLDTANKVTDDIRGRDTATALVREELEKVREMPFMSSADPTAITAYLAKPEVLPGSIVLPNPSSFTSTRRGIVFTTTIASCVVDDQNDGIGATVGDACDPLKSASGGGGWIDTGGSTSQSRNVLGIKVTGDGNPAKVACTLATARPSTVGILLGRNNVLGLADRGARTTFCPDGSSVAFDEQPTDATTVTSTVTWPQSRSGRAGSVTQHTIISGPRAMS